MHRERAQTIADLREGPLRAGALASSSATGNHGSVEGRSTSTANGRGTEAFLGRGADLGALSEAFDAARQVQAQEAQRESTPGTNDEKGEARHD
jgi:hypothetical protein